MFVPVSRHPAGAGEMRVTRLQGEVEAAGQSAAQTRREDAAKRDRAEHLRPLVAAVFLFLSGRQGPRVFGVSVARNR